MLFGLFALAAQDSGLDTWDSIGSIVGGAIAALILVAACFKWLWGKWRAPRVSVTGGQSDVYRKEVNAESRHRIGDIAGNRVHVTRLQVRETNNAAARMVHLRVTQTDPNPGDPLVLPAGLQWVNGEDDLRLPPKGRAYVRLCEAVMDLFGKRRGVLTSVPNLGPGKVVSFTVQVVVDGKPSRTHSFTADWQDEEAHYPEVSDA